MHSLRIKKSDSMISTVRSQIYKSLKSGKLFFAENSPVFKMMSFLIISIILFNPPLSAEEKMKIAVIDFKADGVSEQITRVVSNMIRNRFINSGKFVVLERGQMDEILKAQSLDQLGCTDSSCAVEIGKLLSARKIMVGELSSLGGTKILINIRIVDVEKGISEYSEEEKSTSEDYID